jgi:hypothetical protein
VAGFDDNSRLFDGTNFQDASQLDSLLGDSRKKNSLDHFELPAPLFAEDGKQILTGAALEKEK